MEYLCCTGRYIIFKVLPSEVLIVVNVYGGNEIII